MEGSIKFFNDIKGFGFIEPKTKGGKDVFFHFSAMADEKEVTKNDKGKPCTYDLKEGKNGPEAENLVIL